MSTKTSFKRIAAVAAVALTLGGFSAVSARAAVSADTLTVASSAVSGTVGVKASTTFTTAFIGGASGDYSKVSAVLISSPVGSVALPTVETTTTVTAGTESLVGTTAGKLTTASTGSLEYDSGTFNVALTAAVAGTYVVKLVPVVGNGTTDGTTALATASSVTFTVAAAGGITAAASTSFINAAQTTSGTADATVSAGKAVTAGSVACIKVVENNDAASGAVAVALTATASGPGTVTVSNTAATACSSTGTSGLGRAVTNTDTAVLTQYVGVYADGTAGTSTITISAGTTVLSTETVTFYGAASSITPTVVTPLFAVGTATGAITAVVKDANGNLVTGTPVYAVSDNATAVGSATAYTSCGSSSSTGVVSCDLVGNAAGTANIKLTLNSSSTGTSTVAAAPVAVRVGSATVGSVKWSLDAASYTPGQLATLSVTLLDASGLPVVPGTYQVFTGNPTASLAPATALTVSDGLTAGKVVVAAGSTTGTTTYTFNAPLTAGDLTLKATTGSALPTASQAVAVSLTASISGGVAVDAAQAAQDAANEATDAANAATDAANNAMDSADAAQQAAMDAGDKADAALAAVTDLATKVSEIATQISSLSAVVAKIAAAVAKISAKVKA